jgi:glycerol uptake facilitator-like aquaporin
MLCRAAAGTRLSALPAAPAWAKLRKACAKCADSALCSPGLDWRWTGRRSRTGHGDRQALNGAGHTTGTGVTWKILVVEFVFTFALAYVVLNVAAAKATEGNSYFGLAIGLTVAAGALAVGGISGGAFNPAVALGTSVLGTFSWSHYWIYAIATLLGGAVAARVLYMQPNERAG